VTEFKVPELGENVGSGDVTRVLVNVGDTIARDQPVVELETDKATIEVPSSVAGVVKEIKVKAGDKVKVGATVLVVDEDDARASAQRQAPAPEKAPARSEAEAPNEKQREAAPAAGRRGEVVAMTLPSRSAAPAEPQPSAPRAIGGQTASAAGAEAVPREREEHGPVAAASPSVRRLAREVGIDVNEVEGTGPGGRISHEDVKEHARRILASIGAGVSRGLRAPAARPLPNFEKWGEVDRQPMSNIRRATAAHLSHAWSTVAHVTQCDKADITTLEDLRRKYAAPEEKVGGKLTVTAILIKVLAAAVKRFPQFNASLDAQNEQIVFKKYVNVGVAVDTERGLLVPVIRNVDQKNIAQIAIEVQQAAEKARTRKLTLEDMEGGGISISNLGGIGGTYFTPIVNWPEVAILGVSRGSTEPIHRNGTFEPRLMLPLSLSYDHRLIDGADAIRFLRWVVEALEQPFLLALQG
jgi:pyruvate dehydrogenase E2 component (dihydrolipoamide acetyltransferase)